MGKMVTVANVREASIEAVVYRCRCGTPSAHPDNVCPVATSEPRGTVAYYHRNPLRRLRWFIKSTRRMAR
ncbi:MAG: hypothetical protein RLZZ200_685 [Pseudomonadota bacterium]|jgi:hypothetical protein